MSNIANIEAEEYLISAIINNPQALIDVQQIIHADMFTQSKETPRKEIFEAITIIIQSGRMPDFASIKIEINRHRETGQLEDIYLQGLCKDTAPANTFYCAQVVAEMYMRRDGIRKMQGLIEKLTDFREDCLKSLDELDFEMMAMRAFLQRKRIKSIAEYTTEMYKDWKELKSGEREMFKTGIECLDMAIGGYERGTLNIIAARPGMGKTMFIGQICINAGKRGEPVGILSMEMSGKHLVRRFAGNLARIDTKKIRDPQNHPFEGDEDKRFRQALTEITKLPIHIDETRFPKMGDVLFKMREMVQTHGAKCIIIDHLGLIQFEKKNSNRNLELGIICKMISAQLLILDVPGIILSQLSRKCEDRPDKRPKLSDLRDSGEIEQDAQTVSFLYRDEYYNPDDAKCIDGTPGFNRMEILHKKKREGVDANYNVLGCTLAHQKVFDLDHPPYLAEPDDDLIPNEELNNFWNDNTRTR